MRKRSKFIARAQWACTALALSWWALTLGACRTGGPERAEFTRIAMGVRTTIVIYGADRERTTAAANTAFLRIAELEQALSDWLIDSEANRLSELAGRGPVPIGPDLAFALETALGLAAASEGLFDPTVGPLVREWRAMRESGRLVGEVELASARSLVGWSLVALDREHETATLPRVGMQLDFGGIGKGLAAQAALDRLREVGFPCALVALAGDVAVGTAPPGKQGWSVAVPSAGSNGTPATLSLANAAVSTSGDAEQFVVIRGRRYAHIVDPRTGLGAEAPRTTTVVAPRGELADALSTALSLADDATAERIITKFPATGAVLVDRDGRRTKLDPAGVVVWGDGLAPRPAPAP